MWWSGLQHIRLAGVDGRQTVYTVDAVKIKSSLRTTVRGLVPWLMVVKDVFSFGECKKKRKDSRDSMSHKHTAANTNPGSDVVRPIYL